MPLDAANGHPYGRTRAVTAAFADIGITNGTAAPRLKNIEKLAFEYWAASLLLQLAEIRREKAKRAAIAGGVLPDITTDPAPVGTVATVYQGTLVTIGVKVVAQADKVNVPSLVADLMGAGFASRTVNRLVKKNTRQFNGAHVFTASLIGE